MPEVADFVADMWGKKPDKKHTKKKSTAKKTPNKKKKEKPSPPKNEVEDFNKQVRDVLGGEPSYSDDMSDLIELSQQAKLKQEILKADKLEYQNEQEKMKIEKEAGRLIEYDLAKYLFTGFMEKNNLQMLGMIKKLEPDIINLCRENEPQELIKLLNRNIENIIIDIKNQQKKDVENWKKER